MGALSLAAELFKGACPMMENLMLKDCKVSNRGFGQILQGIKFANLFNIKQLNVRGNFLGPKSIDYLKDACRVGAFCSLEIFDICANELGDGNVLFIIIL